MDINGIKKTVTEKFKYLRGIYADFFIWLNNNKKFTAAKQQVALSVKYVCEYSEKNEKIKKVKDTIKAHSWYLKLKNNPKEAKKWAVIIILAIITANYIFPLKRNPAQVERVIRADAFEVVKAPYADILSSMGIVRGVNSVNIGFQTSGVVKQVFITEGNLVKKGETIAMLDDTDAKLKVEYNESKLKAAEKKLEVHEQLYALKSIILAKLEEVRYEVDTVRKELEFARQELTKTRLVSPLDGILGPTEAEPGEMVTPNTKFTSVFGVGEAYVELGIIEKDVAKLQKQQAVAVTVDAFPKEIRQGAVFSISPVIEGQSRNFKVRVKIPNENKGCLFLPGMFARARITIYDSAATIVIPQSAVKDDTVFLIKDGHAVPIKVTLGHPGYDYVEVSSGLNPGDKIVAEIDGDLSDKPKVEVINTRKYNEKKDK